MRAWRRSRSIRNAVAELGGDFLLDTLLRHTPDQVYFKDRDSRFLKVSAATSRRFGIEDPREVEGKTDLDFFAQESAEEYRADERELMETRQPMIDVEREEIWADGHVTWVSTTKLPLYGRGGETLGIFGMNRDITRRKLAELALLAANERLSAVVDIQREVTQAALDVGQVRRLIVERTRSLAAADGAAILLRAEDGTLVCAEATGRWAERAGTSVAPTAGGPLVRCLEERQTQELVLEDGAVPGDDVATLLGPEARSLLLVPLTHEQAVIGVLAVARQEPTVFDAGLAESLELLSLVLSAALSHAAEFEQRRERIEMLAQFQAIYSRAPIGIATVDPEGVLHEPNPVLCDLLGRTAAELEGSRLDAFIADEDRNREQAELGALLAGSRDIFASEARYVRADGERLWVHVTLSLVRDAGGSPLYAIAMLENVTQRRLAEEAVQAQAAINEYQALHDALTGLPNRTLFHDRLGQALLTAKREGGRVALLMMDLDRFKEVNDTRGHHVGDLLLQELARRLSGLVRASDTVARLGGDEFALVFPGAAERSDVLRLLAKIGASLEAPAELGDVVLPIESSIGVALYPDDSVEGEMLMRYADAAMYVAKAAGEPYAFYADTSQEADA
jgi:diguanylate cyclase (GGDEF)-like protein/PAS domain S-box-containing protein